MLMAGKNWCLREWFTSVLCAVKRQSTDEVRRSVCSREPINEAYC